MGNHGLHRFITGTVAVVLGLALVGSRIEPSNSAGSGSFAADRDVPETASDALAVGVGSAPALSNAGGPVLGGVEAPELPHASVDTTDVVTNGHVIHVAAGGDLQAALDKAQPGDRIALEHGATYRGPFRLPRKDGNAWIVISTGDKDVVPAGQRVGPSDAPMMAKLVSSTGDVIETDAAAHHYRFVGVEMTPTDGAYLRALIQIGAEEGPADALAHHIIVDRCYLHGEPRRGTRRGVALNSRESAVINSYLSDFKEVGADSQAIAGWNGPGPFRIANNYLEAAGENVMFGGADPTIDGLVPADIEIVGNHMAKPLSWRIDDPHFQGTAWTVKNLFELKNARRVLVDGNLFEYNWPHAQNGFAILFTPRNQDGRSPWSVVEDVTFVNNLVRHVAAGINVLGHDDIHSSQPTRRIAIAQQSVRGRRRHVGSGALVSAPGRHERRDDRSQYGAADRHARRGRRSRAPHPFRLSKQHRVSQRVRRDWIGNGHRPSDVRAIFSWSGDPSQRDHRRNGRSLSAGQFLPAVR